MQHLFFEKSVTAFASLMEEVRLLDLDSGIRTFADYEGKKAQYVFITRSHHEGYTLMLYEKRNLNAKAVPGKRLMVKEFVSVDDLRSFLRGMLSRPLRAFIY